MSQHAVGHHRKAAEHHASHHAGEAAKSHAEHHGDKSSALQHDERLSVGTHIQRALPPLVVVHRLG